MTKHFAPKSVFRRLVVTFSAAQFLAAGAVPLADARSTRASATPAYETSHSACCAAAHNPLTCLFCQFASNRARPEPRAALSAVVAESAQLPGAPRLPGAARAPQHRLHSRGPPPQLLL